MDLCKFSLFLISVSRAIVRAAHELIRRIYIFLEALKIINAQNFTTLYLATVLPSPHSPLEFGTRSLLSPPLEFGIRFYSLYRN